LSPPEPSEFHRLLALASPEEKLTIILAGLYTLRRGEIAGLCGEDLLWDLNSIYVHTSRVQNDQKEWVRRPMPKNLNSVRMIQLDPKIMEMLPQVGPNEYVISMNPNEITKHFIRLREKACVSCRFHDLRKYAASIRSAIMPGRYVEADGGWRKDSQVLSTIYDKPFRESRKEYSKKFNEMVVEEYKKELFS
jgi:integrase